MHDHHMAENLNVEEPLESEAGPPDPTPELPVCRREILGAPPLAHLHDSNPVTLLGEPLRGDTPAEPGSDHDEIEIQRGIGHTGLLIPMLPLYRGSHRCFGPFSPYDTIPCHLILRTTMRSLSRCSWRV